MKYGALLPQGWRMDLQGIPVTEQWPTILRLARELEAAGYDSVWLYDHFHTVPEPSQEPTYECWSLMAALAAVTDTIRLGQMCTCNSYRPPALLAKMASTIDVISGGRVEFAIGAGWYEHEYLAYGYEFPAASVRIAQLGEAVEVIKAMWRDDEADYDGEYYTLRGAINQPKPLQRPHPPLWVAGGGEKLTLRIVAEHADYANFAGDLATFVRKSQVLADHCAAVGRDYEAIGRTLHAEFVVGGDEADVAAKLARTAAQRNLAPADYAGRDFTYVGTAGEVAAALAPIRDAGCVYVICYFPDAAWSDSAARFAAEVVPQLG